VIQNNLLYDNHASGISLYRIDGGGGSTGNKVLNNTVIVANNGRWALNIRDGSTANTAYNNIFYNYHSFRGSISVSASSLPGFVSDYNVVMDRFTTNDGASVQTLAQWRTNTGQDMHSIIATPAALFVNAGADDYHLVAGSPAIDIGTSTFAPTRDIANQTRPRGAGWDIGAYEFIPAQVENTVGVEADPNGSGAQALVVRGTSAGDTITFASARGGSHIAVKVNGVARGSYLRSTFVRIVAYGLDGNDTLSLGSGLQTAAHLDGGAGDDTLYGGAASDVLLGGAGNDTLTGRQGRNIYVGGDGADVLKGASSAGPVTDGSDLLIGGQLTHAASDAALWQIVQEWTSSRTYQERTTRLSTGADGLPKLDATTVLDDGAEDQLAGAAGLDWYFANVPPDILIGRKATERVN
jgi:hypothetical protein